MGRLVFNFLVFSITYVAALGDGLRWPAALAIAAMAVMVATYLMRSSAKGDSSE